MSDQIRFVTDAGYLKDYFDALATYREEGIVTVSDDAVYSTATDPADSGMVITRVSGKALIEMEGSEDPIEIGAKYERLIDVLEGVSSSSEVEFTYPVVKDSTNNIRIHVPSNDLTFHLPAVDKNYIEDTPQKKPMSHKTRIVLGGKALKKAISQCGKVYPKDEGSLEFKTLENKLVLEAYHESNGSVDKEFYSGTSGEGGLDEHEVSMSYDLLKDIKKIIGSSEEVTLHIKTDAPLRLDVSLDERGDAQAIYLIAPRIES